MNPWRFEYGPNAYQVNIDATILPGVKCSVCGQAWSSIAHEMPTLTTKAKAIINSAKRPMSSEDFNSLIKMLATTTNDQRWMRQNPGSMVGELKIRPDTGISKQRLLWSIYGPVFLINTLADKLLTLCPDHTESIQWLPGHKYAELVSAKIDLADFGAKKICVSCGRLDYGCVNEALLIEHITEAEPLSFFHLPYGPVFGHKTKLVLEHILNESEATFVPWTWPNDK